VTLDHKITAAARFLRISGEIGLVAQPILHSF
jgi:hypothetical protein